MPSYSGHAENHFTLLQSLALGAGILSSVVMIGVCLQCYRRRNRAVAPAPVENTSASQPIPDFVEVTATSAEERHIAHIAATSSFSDHVQPGIGSFPDRFRPIIMGNFGPEGKTESLDISR